jgi:hypothetical protein
VGSLSDVADHFSSPAIGKNGVLKKSYALPVFDTADTHLWLASCLTATSRMGQIINTIYCSAYNLSQDLHGHTLPVDKALEDLSLPQFAPVARKTNGQLVKESFLYRDVGAL